LIEARKGEAAAAIIAAYLSVREDAYSLTQEFETDCVAGVAGFELPHSASVGTA
jgi:hypothetical protein